jgi:hypothetical protein
MIPRTDEPMEGVVFDVQDHTRRTGTSGPVHMGIWLVRTSMGLKSPSDGCWDGRGRTTLWWAICTKKEEGHPYQDTMAEPGLGGITHCRWDDCFWWTGRHLRQLDVFWSMWQCAGVIWHVWQLGEALEGPTFCFLDADLAQKGSTSPSEGPDVSLLSSYCDIFSI